MGCFCLQAAKTSQFIGNTISEFHGRAAYEKLKQTNKQKTHTGKKERLLRLLRGSSG